MSREDKKLSDAMRLFEALSGVDEELLIKADGKMPETEISKKKKIFAFSGSKIRLAASLAAAASLFLVVGAVWTGAPMLNGKKSAETAAMTKDEMMTVPTASSANDTVEVVEEAMSEETMAGGLLIESTEETESKAGSSTGKRADSTVGAESGKSSNMELESQKAEETDGGKDALTDVSEGIKPDDRVKLTEAQAQAVEVLGSCVPTNLPKGYVWETAKASVNAKTKTYESLFLCWTRGMDSIMITVSLIEPDSITLTDITKKETYDVSLYEIPYVETVPEEYRQIFDTPVFAAEDLSLELVESRMKAIQDSGDTDTPRGKFSILYPEGILLDFNGDGTAEEIWEMLR